MTEPVPFRFGATTPGAKAFLCDSQKRLLIDGLWVDTEQRFASIDPATGDVLANVARAGTVEIDLAVRAARRAFEGVWADATPMARALLLWAIADLLEAHIDELAELETLDQGKPLFVGRWAEIPGAIEQFRFFAGQATAIEGRTITPSITYQPVGKQVRAWTPRGPVGVVAAIVPWNSPLVLTAMKLVPALAAGCTIVLKPAEDTSLTALRLGELLLEAGLPLGVVNVVTGCAADSAILREEVFGPVLAVQAFGDLDTVIEAANDSDYGLAAIIWTESLSHAHRLSGRLRAGTVWINCHLLYDSALPIGGVKQSGWGRDSGTAAMDGYLEWKTVCAVV